MLKRIILNTSLVTEPDFLPNLYMKQDVSHTVKSFIFVGPNFRGFMKMGTFVGT